MASFALVSLGCPKNQVDSEWLVEVLKEAGFRFEVSSLEADLVIINTCAFINSAREEAIDTIWSYVGLKQERAEVKLAVAGCLVQGFGKEAKDGFPEVDYWLLGPDDEEGLQRLIKDFGGRRSALLNHNRRPILLGEPGSAYLKVAEGCNNRCSYCSIPLIKGPLASRSIDEIDGDAASLVEQGVKEVVLIAQDLTAYGTDRNDGSTLTKLVKKVLTHPFAWVRLMYVYPQRIDDELIELLAGEERLCPYLDVPFQHCNEKVLKLMGRKGNKDEYLALVQKMREKIPNMVIRTTFLVGHPGEGEKEFEELKSFVEEASFEWLGVFPYSPEENTPSFAMKDRPPLAKALGRAEEIELLYRAVRRSSAFGIGSVKEALVIDDVDDILVLRSMSEAPEVDGVILARKEGPVPSLGEITELKLLGADELDFVGQLIGS